MSAKASSVRGVNAALDNLGPSPAMNSPRWGQWTVAL